MKIIKTIILIIIITLCLSQVGCTKQIEADIAFSIVTSTYPTYTMAYNIVKDIESIKLENMTESNAGCLHDYTLNTNDLIKLENTNAFIINGNGLEDAFLSKITQTYSDLTIINSSENISQNDLIKSEHETNVHTWTSIKIYKQQFIQILNELCKLDKSNQELYKNNANKYIEQLDNLIAEQNNIDSKGLKVICFSDSLEYFLKDCNIETITINTHEDTFSGEYLKRIINQAKNENIKTIIIDNQTNEKQAEMLRQELEANIYTLDDITTKQQEFSADDYINRMTKNLDIIKEMLK